MLLTRVTFEKARGERLIPPFFVTCRRIEVEFRTGTKCTDPLKTRGEVSRLALMSKRVTAVYVEAQNAQTLYTSKYKVRYYASF